MAPPSSDAAPVRALESDDSNSDHEHELPPLSNPPPHHDLLTTQFETLDDLEDQLHDFTARAGFSVYRRRSSNKVKDFGYSRIDFACSQNKITASTARSRASSTIKHDCGWRGLVMLPITSVSRRSSSLKINTGGLLQRYPQRRDQIHRPFGPVVISSLRRWASPALTSSFRST